MSGVIVSARRDAGVAGQSPIEHRVQDNVRIGLRTKDEPDTSASSWVRRRTRRQQTALNSRCCTVDDAAKRSAERQ